MSIYTISTYYLYFDDNNYSHSNFFYFNNNKTTLNDLFEYIAIVYSHRNICKCYDFSISNNNSNYLKANDNELLYKYYQSNSSQIFIQIKLNGNYCKCDQNCKKYFQMSKANIINDFLKIENKIKEEKEKNELKIQNFNNEKNVLNKDIEIKNKEIENKNDYIKRLEKESSEQKIKIENLESKINNLNESIKNLEIEKQSQKNEIIKFKKEIEDLNKKIVLLEEKKKSQENQIIKLNEEINESKNKEKILQLAVDKDLDTLNAIQRLGVGKDLKPKYNTIKIDESKDTIVENKNFETKDKLKNFDNNFEDFYDIIIDIKSIKDINKGWVIKSNERGRKQYFEKRDEPVLKIGVIGNADKGKSFLLSKISKIDFPSGTSISTEGLSIKYPELEEYINRRIVLLDSAGLETPVLKDVKEIIKKEIIKEENDLKEKEEEIDNSNENNEIEENDNSNGNIEIKDEKEKNKEKIIEKNNANENNGKCETKEEKITNDGNDKNNFSNENILFKEKSREKLITELFLQNYIIHNSDILILVVGKFTFSEQKLLNKIKTEIKRANINKPLFIIHNLFTFTSKKQVEDHIKEYLLKSATFDLEKGHKTSTEKIIKDGIYYYEKDTSPTIYHLIYANEGSEAGKFYNRFTLNFIENSFQQVTNLKPFDVIKSVKERFVELSKEIIEIHENNKFDKESFEDSEKLIKLKNSQEIVLKKCLIDELGFSNLRENGFVPAYNFYKTEQSIVIVVECPGKCSIIPKTEFIGEYTMIKLNGEKKHDEEKEKIENRFHSTREYGKFCVEIPLKSEDFLIKHEKPKINC